MPDKIGRSRSMLTKSTRKIKIEDSNDRVTFVSTNKKDDTKFVGSALPGSRLAATLAQIAATVQSDNLPTPRHGGTSRQGLLPSTEALRGQIQDSTTPQNEGQERNFETRDRSGYVEDMECLPSHTQASVTQGRRGDSTVPIARRLETDQKIEYHTRGPNGELYVSAPTGSNEAQLFDEVARRLTKSNERRSSSKKEQSSKSKGWLTWG